MPTRAPTHRPHGSTPRKAADRAYDRRRGKTAARGYDATWRRVAKQRRELDYYLCRQCKSEGRNVISNLVDHIIPVHVRPDLRLDLANTQVLCPSCHGKKTDEDARRYGSAMRTT